MREIKFRGWNGSKMIDLHKVTPFAVDSKLTDLQDGLYLPLREDIPLMQYTGLKDKNGKEIYEGDIVKDSTGSCYDVVFEAPSFTLNWAMLWLDERCEVIGNIYENKELLK